MLTYSLIIDLCEHNTIRTNRVNQSTIRPETVLKSRILVSSGYRVLFVNISALMPNVIKLSHYVTQANFVGICQIMNTCMFRVSQRGKLIHEKYGHFLSNSNC